jgi:hypothetical protein
MWDKLKMFIDLCCTAFLSLGRALTSLKYRDRWRQLVFQKQETRFALQITRVLGKEPVEKDAERVASLQEELNRAGIALNCQNPPRQEKLNDFDHEAIETYLSSIRDLNMRANHEKFLREGLDKITVRELEEALPPCVQYLSSCLKPLYQLGFVAKKSSQWIAEQALPYLSVSPAAYFEHSTDTISSERGRQSQLISKGKQFVIFDDASYSGQQAMTIISELGAHLAKQKRKGKLFLVIPFISALAEKRLINRMKEKVHFDKRFPLKMHVITSMRKIKGMSDFAKNNPATNKPISFTEWKVPDNDSLDTTYTIGQVVDEHGKETSLPLLTDYPPCYKADETIAI